MRVAVNVLEFAAEPRVSVQRQPALMMALRTGSSATQQARRFPGCESRCGSRA
jgi:hypothetical protein